MHRKLSSVSVVLLAGWMISAGPVSAQTADTAILGSVVDASGAVVPAAAVEISQPATGFARGVPTNSNGDYELRYLVPGEYEVSISAAGFAPQRRTGVMLRVGQQARVDFNLAVGAVSESVSVS